MVWGEGIFCESAPKADMVPFRDVQSSNPSWVLFNDTKTNEMSFWSKAKCYSLFFTILWIAQSHDFPSQSTLIDLVSIRMLRRPCFQIKIYWFSGKLLPQFYWYLISKEIWFQILKKERELYLSLEHFLKIIWKQWQKWLYIFDALSKNAESRKLSMIR